MSDWDIKGKVCIVTGSNCGIGRETALKLVQLGAGRVILACRNLEAGEEALKYIRETANLTGEDAEKRVVLRKLDLASFASIRAFAKQINEEEKQLHVLINNAGLYAPSEKTYTADGFELTFGTNHLGPFLLTNLLLDLLKRSKPSRIVNVASTAYWMTWWGLHDDYNYDRYRFNAWAAYSQSKLANMLHARELDRRLNGDGEDSGVTTYSLHPGVINSNFMRNRHWFMRMFIDPVSALFFSNNEQGSRTSVYCATEPGIEKYSGQYFYNSAPCTPWAIARDDDKAKMLWEASERFIAEKSEKLQ